MDSEVSKALRWLGRNFDASQYSTIQLLKAVGINRVFIVTGFYTGFFFRLEDLKKSLEAFDAFLNDEEKTAIDEFLTDVDVKTPFFRIIIDAHRWESPRRLGEYDGGGHLCIRVFDLSAPNSLACCYNDATSQLSTFLTARCDNCKSDICIAHFLTCMVCNKDGCIACCCISDETIARGTDIMCFACAEKAGISDLASREEKEEALDSLPSVAHHFGNPGDDVNGEE